MSYTIEDHKHLLAAWDASTSARASPLCRFKVEQGIRILESAGFGPAFATVDCLPASEPKATDAKHRKWRKAVIRAAKGQKLTFTHGVAAKLINCYLKARFVCGGHHDHPRVDGLHPPIDAVLLKALAHHPDESEVRRKEWRKFLRIGWSNFSSDIYEDVIACVRDSLGDGVPLWMIEQHWKGHQ